MFVGINLGINLRSSVSFSPSALFAAGEPGVWFDPSDVANLDWRVNLLQQTEAFNDVVWGNNLFGNWIGATVTVDTDVAPDGTLTADTLGFTSSLSNRMQVINVTPNVAYTFSLYVKGQAANSYGSGIYLRVATGLNGNLVLSSYATTRVDDTLSNAAYTRFSVSFTVPSSGVNQVSVGLTGLGTAPNPTANIYTWGAQLQTGLVATTYQPITTVDEEALERFPSATLYQDLIGTIPVTTPGQTVALMLDKSKGGPGPELVTNGNFASGSTGWAIGNASWGVVSGVMVNNGSNIGVAANVQQASIVTSGKTYRITFDFSRTSGGLNLWLAGSQLIQASINTTGSKSFTVAATVTGSIFFEAQPDAVLSIDNVSVREIPGNHATQNTPAARPNYAIEPAGGRRNLLEQTETFENAYWIKQELGITANATIAPDGTLTAEKITPTAISSTHSIYRLSIVSSQTCTISFYLKSSGYDTVDVRDGATASNGAIFNSLTGLSTNVGTGLGSMSPVGNGWYRCVVTVVTTGLRFYIPNSASNFTGDGTSGVFLWGAQLEVGSTATPYQRVTTQYDVTQAGKPSMSYLYFDGVNDAMATSTITPGIDKVQVFAGVKKLSDTFSVYAELGPLVNNTNGSFWVGPYTGYGFGSRGTVYSDALFSPVANPNTSVLTALGDISGDVSRLRVNGAQVVQNTTDQGTGNYLAYPIYIGSRGGSSSYLPGHIYSLITRFGTTLPDSTITSTERWVAGKTGFYPPIITGVPTIGVS